MKLEFNDVDECLRFMEYIKPSERKEAVTTEIRQENEKWLNLTRLNGLSGDILRVWDAIDFNPKMNRSEKIARLENDVTELKTIVKVLTGDTVKEEDEDIKEPEEKPKLLEIPDKYKDIKTVRDYAPSYYYTIPKIKRVTKTGRLQLKYGGYAKKYTINTLLTLKKLINKTDESLTKISKKIGLNDATTRQLCCGIEIGVFDGLFSEWEQMQANKFYKKEVKKEVINNPQRRRENGMI